MWCNRLGPNVLLIRFKWIRINNVNDLSLYIDIDLNKPIETLKKNISHIQEVFLYVQPICNKWDKNENFNKIVCDLKRLE